MKKIICFLLGHRYFVIKQFSDGSRKVGCKRCKMVWGMNDRMKAFLKWDWEFEKFYAENYL